MTKQNKQIYGLFGLYVVMVLFVLVFFVLGLQEQKYNKGMVETGTKPRVVEVCQ